LVSSFPLYSFDRVTVFLSVTIFSGFEVEVMKSYLSLVFVNTPVVLAPNLDVTLAIWLKLLDNAVYPATAFELGAFDHC